MHLDKKKWSQAKDFFWVSISLDKFLIFFSLILFSKLCKDNIFWIKTHACPTLASQELQMAKLVLAQFLKWSLWIMLNKSSVPWSQDVCVCVCVSVCVCVCVWACVLVLSHVWLCAAPWTVVHLYPLDFQGKNTGVHCHFLLQECQGE